MSSDVLPDAAIVAGALGTVQLLKSLVPQMVTWPNNAVRALTFALVYAMVVVNHVVAGPFPWQDLWGLLPLAGALSGSATLIYHLATDSAPRATTPPQESRTIVAPPDARVQVTVPPAASPGVAAPAAGAVPVAPPPSAPTITTASSPTLTSSADSVPPPPP